MLDLDTDKYPKEKDDLHIFRIDEAVSKAAAEGIRNDAPDLSWVYLWYTDDAGHIYGNSDFFDRYTLLADKQVERIWEAVKYRGGQLRRRVVSNHYDRSRQGAGRL